MCTSAVKRHLSPVQQVCDLLRVSLSCSVSELCLRLAFWHWNPDTKTPKQKSSYDECCECFFIHVIVISHGQWRFMYVCPYKCACIVLLKAA